jgi:1,4-dihydroxy-2-naphthoate octaprenyltransferase
LGRQVLLLRIGWQRGMNLHNYALIGSYLLLGVFFAFVLPWSLTWPYLLSIPFAIYQIVQMQQIANGARPNWRFLNLTAAATFAIASYMITITLWIR